MRVKPPWPSATTPEAAPERMTLAPLVWPETRLMAPWVEAPKVVPKEWSFIA